MMLLLWASTAFGHGGPPNSEKLLWGPSDDALVVSTHGFLFEDEGWNWVCEEFFGDSLPTDVIRTESTILVAGTAGLAHSADGCAWDWNAQFEDELIWDLAIDPTISSRVWLVSDTGLWRSDDEGSNYTNTDFPISEAKLRSVVPMPNDEVTVFGFLDGQATVWQGSGNDWMAAELDVRSGHLLGLGTDSQGNVYGHFPRASGTDQLIRINPQLEASTLLETERRIGAFLAVDAGLMISVDGEGTWLSPDQGDSWAWEEAETYACLIERDGRIFACPKEGSESIWVHTDTPILSTPKNWQMGPQFSDVSGSRCGEELPVCEDLWPTVALELGVDPRDNIEPDASTVQKKTSGCGSQAAVLFLPCWFMGRIRRRVRQNSVSHTTMVN